MPLCRLDSPRQASSASATWSRAKPRLTICSSAPWRLVGRLPGRRMIVPGASTRGIFATRTDTYGRSSSTRRPAPELELSRRRVHVLGGEQLAPSLGAMTAEAINASHRHDLPILLGLTFAVGTLGRPCDGVNRPSHPFPNCGRS